jgi:hypothetical protein
LEVNRKIVVLMRRYGNDSQEIEPLGNNTPMISKTYRHEHHVNAERADGRTGGFCVVNSSA